MKESVPRQAVLEDWRWLRESGRLDLRLSFREQVRAAAPSIGMRPGALEKALRRAGVRSGSA